MKIHSLLILFTLLISCSEKNKQPEFKTEAYATIEINQKNHSNDSIEVAINHISIIPDNSKRENQILSEDTEYIYIETDRASNADLAINNFNHRIWLSPNDTTIINLSESGEIESFEGKLKRENDYFMAKKKEIGFLTIIEPFNQDLKSFKSHNQLKHTIDSLSNIESDFLRNHKDDLPTEFKNFEENEIIYNSAVLKVEFPLFNRVRNIIKEPLPDNYYNFIENFDLNNFNAIPTSSYFGFLTNYFWKDSNQETLKNLGGKERTIYLKNHLFKDANEFLDPEIKEYFLAHHFTDLIKLFKKDELDSILDKWEIKTNKDLIQKTINQKLTSNEGYEEGSKTEDFEMLNEKGETVRISDYKDKIVYLNFWGTWCKPCIANIPDLNKFIESYQGNKEVVFINLAIKSKEENWKESIQKFDLKGLNLFIPKGENHDRIRAKFGVGGLPHYAIIGKENILKVNYANKAPKVKTKLDALLKVNN
ncbi:MAG: TlpA family protein disulfide reductase [Bacteroidota bacterium]